MRRPITALLADAHRARMEVQRIEREMRACQCQREDTDAQDAPCWKATWNPPEYDTSMDAPRLAFPGYWDHAGGNADDGKNHHLLWCKPCQQREKLRAGLEPARRRLAGLKSAIWAAAKRAAETELGAKS
jgi:hypothetical protein